MIRKLTAALVTLGLTASAAQAAYPTDEVLPAAPPTVAVTIPQQTGSWSIGIEALYQEVDGGDFYYADRLTSRTAGTVTTNDYRRHNLSQEYDWGGAIDVTYNFPGNGEFVKLSWKHLDSDDSEHKTQGSIAGTTLFGPGYNLNPAGAEVGAGGQILNVGLATNVIGNGWDSIHASNKDKYDHVDLMFGQRMDFGDKVRVALSGGLRYVDLDSRAKAHFASGPFAVAGVATTESANLHTKSSFQGLGPRGQIDTRVNLMGNFAVVGTFGGSLLAGDSKHKLHSDISLTAAGTTATVNQNRHGRENFEVIPELDARIGLNYGMQFNPDTALAVEVGYEVINYFNAKNESLASYADTMNHTNDFSIDGPYLRVQLDLA